MSAGYVAFPRERKGTIHDLGLVGIGFGLMLTPARSDH